MLPLPKDGTFIEMTASGEVLPDVRVEHASEAMITLSLALADIPPADAAVELRWAAAPRGRYAIPGQVTGIDGNRVEVRFVGDAAMVQTRNFVRGGGGEPIHLLQPGEDPARGFVHDLSERSVRAHFTDVHIRPGDTVILQIQVADEVVQFPARATKVSSMRQQVPRRGPLSVEMVAVFESSDEHQARMIRRYIMRHEMSRRANTAGGS